MEERIKEAISVHGGAVAGLLVQEMEQYITTCRKAVAGNDTREFITYHNLLLGFLCCIQIQNMITIFEVSKISDQLWKEWEQRASRPMA